MKRVLVNPITKKPTCFEPLGDIAHITEGPYQNVTDVTDEWFAIERRRVEQVFSVEEKSMLEKLKSLNLSRLLDVDSVVESLATADLLITAYATAGVTAPQWLRDVRSSLLQEIKARTNATKLAELREAEALIESLKSAAEKKRETQERIDRLRKELGQEE